MLIGMSAFAVVTSVLAAESRDFNNVTPAHYVHQPESPADNARAAKQRPDPLRGCIGGHVKVLWLTS